MDDHDIKNNREARFAITAHTTGRPLKLYTPIMVFNPEALTAGIVNAMWDTGAESCIMSARLAERLGFRFKAKARAKGLTGSSTTTVGYAYISLAAGAGIITTKAYIVDGHVGGDEYSFIIGLSVISLGTFTVSYKGADTNLSFVVPSDRLVDYTEECGHRPTEHINLSFSKDPMRICHGKEALEMMNKALPPEIFRDLTGLS